MDALLGFWARMPATPPYIHPDDVPFFENYCESSLDAPPLDVITCHKYADAMHEYFFHLSLTPVPYVGNLSEADIIILRLNPGFSDDGTEYEVEAQEDVQRELINTLRQRSFDQEYPFWYLNPRYAAHPGHAYWLKNLRRTGEYQLLSQRIALLQLMPYHSAKFDPSLRDKVIPELKSATAVRSYLHNVIMPKARLGHVLLLATRGVRNWGLTEADAADNVVIYKPTEAIHASLTSGRRGGQAIINWLSKNR